MTLTVLQARGCDAVQGSTYIRNVASSAEQGLRQRLCHALLARFINAEFFVQVCVTASTAESQPLLATVS